MILPVVRTIIAENVISRNIRDLIWEILTQPSVVLLFFFGFFLNFYRVSLILESSHLEGA